MMKISYICKASEHLLLRDLQKNSKKFSLQITPYDFYYPKNHRFNFLPSRHFGFAEQSALPMHLSHLA